MNKFIITTDNTVDLPQSYILEHNLPLMHLSYSFDDQVYAYQNALSSAPFLRRRLWYLHIAFTSGLSGTYNSVRIAAEELQPEFPNAKIIILDSLCASLGEGLLVHKALILQKEGKSMTEICDWIQENKLHIIHDVVAEDLFHLQRGGRISKSTAIIGSALGVRPLIQLTEEGKLESYGKNRGKKAALRTLADHLIKNVKDMDCDTVFISHSDCLKDAEYLKAYLQEKTDIQNFLIHFIGPTIGAHTGVGTVALFYFGKSRKIQFWPRIILYYENDHTY